MNESKTIAYFKLFNKHELNKLDDFIQSPYQHVYPDVVRLFSILKNEFPNYQNELLTKEFVFDKLFPHEKFTLQKLSNNLKYLNECIEEFIISEQLKNKSALKFQLLAEKLRSKERRLYKDAIDKTTIAIEKKSFSDTSEYLLAQLNNHNEKDNYFTTSEAREENQEIQLKNEGLDVWYIYQKLKIFCEMINRQNIVSAKYEYTFKEELINYIKAKSIDIKAFPSIEIYYTIYHSLTDASNEEHYHHLISLLKKNEKQFSHQELRSMYDFAQNYCIKKLNSGLTHYAEILFTLFKHLIETQILFTDDKKLSQWDYKNIVTLSLRLKHNKWCEHFIEEYKSALPKSEIENAYRYNLSYYFVNINNYKEAKRLLQRVEFNDLFYQLGSKSLLLRCYYELKDIDSFLLHCESFDKLLLRHKTISDYQRTVHLNLIRYTKKTFRLSIRRNEKKANVAKKEIDNLKATIQANKQINNLPWLLEKIEELY